MRGIDFLKIGVDFLKRGVDLLKKGIDFLKRGVDFLERGIGSPGRGIVFSNFEKEISSSCEVNPLPRKSTHLSERGQISITHCPNFCTIRPHRLVLLFV